MFWNKEKQHHSPPYKNIFNKQPFKSHRTELCGKEGTVIEHDDRICGTFLPTKGSFSVKKI